MKENSTTAVKQRILVVNGSADLYGSGRILAYVLQVLATKYEIVLVLPFEGPLIQFLEDNNIPVKVQICDCMPFIARRLNSPGGMLSTGWRFLKALRYFRQLVKKENIRLGYVNTLSCFLVLKILNMLGLKVIVHVHEIIIDPVKVAKLINRYAVKWVNKVICVSAPVRDNLLKYNTDEEGRKLLMILNGIEDKFRQEYQHPSNEVIVTLIGRIIVNKGIWFFLDAITQLPENVAARCAFRIIGGPAPGGEGMINKLQQDIALHKYGTRISYMPFVENVTALLNETDIVVVPSLHPDPFPTTILEGLSAEKAVIATNRGGAIQSIIHNETGLLIDSGDVQQFTAALETLICDDEKRTCLSKNARRSYLEKFQVASFQQKILQAVEGEI